MDTLAVGGLLLSTGKDIDRIQDIRAEKREHFRGRKNKTSCRSPTRELDTRELKNKRKEKRHLEFLRRRSVSPKSCSMKSADCSTGGNPSPDIKSERHYSSSSKSETLHTNTQNSLTGNGHTEKILTPSSSETDEVPRTSGMASLQSGQIPLMRPDKGHDRTEASTSAEEELNQHSTEGTAEKDRSINVQKTNIKSEIHQNPSKQNRLIIEKNILENTSMKTEPGFVLVRESDLERLGDYLQEALWREELLRKKLAALHQSTSNLLNSSNSVWTSRCREDLLNSKIQALEAQLQTYVQKFSKDGMKKLMVQMEQQMLAYEEKALKALQKATKEKAEALSQAEILQEALIAEKVEALRWQNLYEELKLSSGQLRQNQHWSDEQLQQLHSQVELSTTKDNELREEVSSLQQEKQELQYNVRLLQEDNQSLREEIEHLRDGSDEIQDYFTEEYLLSETAERTFTARTDSQLKEQLRVAEEKLQLKESECEELQSGLHAMEQECVSTQARLTQCRDELRQLSHRRRSPTRCGSWWRMFTILLLLLAVTGVVTLWFCHPPFREQVEDLYSDIGTRIENYLLDKASPGHAGCYKPT